MPLFTTSQAIARSLTGWVPGADVPTPPDDQYVTHIRLEQEGAEEEEEKTEEKVPDPEAEAGEVPEEPGTAAEPPAATEEIPGAGGEDMMGIGGLGGLGTEEEEGPKSPEEVGKIYELKKIHARLVSIESYLSGSSDVKLLKLRNYVSQAIELFQTLIQNADLFQDKMNDIIVTFYSFLESVYEILSTYYRKKQAEK